MDLNRKNVKLAPINVDEKHQTGDRRRLKRGCTSLMYACQQGLTDKIVKEIRSQVTTAQWCLLIP